jgi:recombination protein RecA
MPTELDAVIAAVNKKAKREVLVRGADLRHQTFQRVTTGSLSFDLALGGGWPLNVPNEIIGLESMGKTVMAMQTVAANQGIDPDYHTVWGASEELDPVWAAKNGMDLDRVTFVMTNVMEEMYDSILQVLEKRACDAVVLDSLPALMPELEDEKSMFDPVVGKGALLTNKFFRKLYGAQNRSLVEYDRPALLLVINQWREMIGVMHGDPRTTPGGKGKNYAYMTRVEVTREEWLKDGDRQVGQVIKVRTIKNKTAPRWRTGQVDFYFDDSGDHEAGRYDTLRDVWSVAEDVGVIERKGAWYHFKNRKWNGKEAVWTAIQADPKLAMAIDTAVRTELGVTPPPAAATPKRRTVKRR